MPAVIYFLAFIAMTRDSSVSVVTRLWTG